MLSTKTKSRQGSAVANGGSGIKSKQERVGIAVKKVVDVTGCKPGEAHAMIKWLEPIVDRARQSTTCETYPTDAEMRTPEYRLFDTVLGHVQPTTTTAPPTDSAAESVCNAVIDPSRGEFGLTHFQRDAYPHYCTVRVLIGVAK